MKILAACAATALSAALSACGAPQIGDEAAAAPAATLVPRGTTLVLGSVGDDAVEEAMEFQPFADELARRLSGAGIEQGRVIVAPSMPEMTRLMAAGEVDVFMDSPYPAMTVAQGAGGEPLLNRWKGGDSTYHSVVFVLADSPIHAVEDLRGKRIGFDDDFSTSGYFLPKATLVAGGLSLVQLPAEDSPVPAGDIGYVFTEDDENTLYWVSEGRVEAGAMSEGELRELAGDSFDQLRILASSPDVPRQIVVRAGALRPELSSALSAALAAMDKDAEGVAAMAAFEETTRFEPLDAQTKAALRTLISQVPPAADAN